MARKITRKETTVDQNVMARKETTIDQNMMARKIKRKETTVDQDAIIRKMTKENLTKKVKHIICQKIRRALFTENECFWDKSRNE